MVGKAVFLALLHFLVFFGFYVFDDNESSTSIIISIVLFVVASVMLFRHTFTVENFSHFKAILFLFGTLTLSSIFHGVLFYGFETYYDTEYRYREEQARIEAINERRDRRGLPREYFDKAKVDERYTLKGYLNLFRDSSIFNAVAVLLFLYPLGLFYRAVTTKRLPG
jgi:hypothetical protein